MLCDYVDANYWLLCIKIQKNALFIYVPWTLQGRRQVQTWIKIRGPPLISVLIKGGSLLFQFSHPFKLTYLVTNSLYQCLVWVWVSVRNNDSLSKSIYCNLNNNIACCNMVTCTTKLFNHTIPNKGSQVIDLPASTFEGLRYRE